MFTRSLMAVAGAAAILASSSLAAQPTNSNAATPAVPATPATPATDGTAATPATPAVPANKDDSTTAASDPLAPTEGTVTNGKAGTPKKKAAAKKPQ